MTWATVRIGDLGHVVTGKTPPSSQPAMFVGNVPFFTPSDMDYDKRDVEPDRHVSEEWDTRRRGLLPAHSVCVVCIGATIGKVCMTSRPSHTNQQVNSVVVDEKCFDPGFVYYSLRMIGDELKSKAAGAATPIINKSSFSDVTIRAPSLQTQQRIAAILGAYDDLIEVNRRRVAVLEEMARGLSEEWFVRFRFPGYKDVPIVNTPDGPLPEGWEWRPFSSLAQEVRETVAPSEVDSDTRYVGLEHLPRRSTTLADCGQADEVGSTKARFRRGDILFGKIRPYFHKVAWAPFDGIASTDAIIWRPTVGRAARALAVASSDAFVAHAVQTSNGTKMPRANSKVLAAYRCAQSNLGHEETYERVAMPLIEQAATLQTANEKLASARDLLLPRLISGQHSVESAGRELEDAA